MYRTDVVKPAAIEGLEFNPIGKHLMPSKSEYFNQSDNFTLLWIRNGSGIICLDMESFPIWANTLCYVCPGQLYRLLPEGDTDGYEIRFTHAFVSDGIAPLPKALMFSNPAEQVKYLGCEGPLADEMADIFQDIHLEYSNHYASRSEMLQGLLSLVISHFPSDDAMDHADRKAGNDKMIWTRFIRSVENNFRNQKQVRDYAAELAVSPNYLTEIIRRVSGFSPRHHIHQRLLLEAKRLAVSSSRPAVEIALDLGFDNPFTFSKFFKTLTGTTFSDFRKENRSRLSETFVN